MAHTNFGFVWATLAVWTVVVQIQRDFYVVMVSGKAEYDLEPVVIVRIHREQERVEQLCQELFVFYIPGTEKLKPGNEIIPVDFDPLCFGRVDFG